MDGLCPLAYKVCHLTNPALENILLATKESLQAWKSLEASRLYKRSL